LRTTTTQNHGDDIEKKIGELATRVAKIADDFFLHPVRVQDLRVPFKEHDVLRIRFREPVAIKCIAEYRYAPTSKSGISASITYDRTCCEVAELDVEFLDGSVLIISAKDANGFPATEYDPQYSSTLFLSTLFTTEIFGKLESAEISSEHSVADKWFSELIDAYREISGYKESIDIQDLYDRKTIIGKVALRVFMGRSIMLFELFRDDPPELRIATYVIRDTYTDLLGSMYYSFNNRKVSDTVAFEVSEYAEYIKKFPASILSDVHGFLNKLFNAYAKLAVAISYISL